MKKAIKMSKIMQKNKYNNQNAFGKMVVIKLKMAWFDKCH